ncbi:hypothetical protein NEUTE2DRAFT_77010 [Neurospora tetrasperma FGSC 2509]|nr:hypothetical protein NEUTE2DRAFT_77010 [Neurospora tetrasperma FGSC 2509]
MAPRKPPPPPVVRLTAKGIPAKKRGPAPKPISERPWTAPKPVRRVERSYSRERKIEVLQFLLNHRIADYRPRKAPRRRIGQPPHEQEPVPQTATRDANGQLVWYRAPTYVEASEWWKIPIPTIQGWWDSREKILEGTGIELPKSKPGDYPGSDQPRPGTRVEFIVNPQSPQPASREGSEQPQLQQQPQQQPTAPSSDGSARGSQQRATMAGEGNRGAVARNTPARAISISSASSAHTAALGTNVNSQAASRPPVAQVPPAGPHTQNTNGPVVVQPGQQLERPPAQWTVNHHPYVPRPPGEPSYSQPPQPSQPQPPFFNPYQPKPDQIPPQYHQLQHTYPPQVAHHQPPPGYPYQPGPPAFNPQHGYGQPPPPPPHYGPPHQAPHTPGPLHGHPGYPPYPQPSPGGPVYPPHQGAPYQGGPPPQPYPGSYPAPYTYGPQFQMPMIVQFPQFTPYYATPQAPPYAQPAALPPNLPPQPSPFAPGGPGQVAGPAPGMVPVPPFPGSREFRPPGPAPPQPGPGPVSVSGSTQSHQAAASGVAPNPPVTPPRQQPAEQPSDAQGPQSEPDEASPAGQLLAEQEARNTVQDSQSQEQSVDKRPAVLVSFPEAGAALEEPDHEMGQVQDQDQEQDQEMDQDQEEQEKEQDQDQDLDQEEAQEMEEHEEEQEHHSSADISASGENDKEDGNNVSSETHEKLRQDKSADVESTKRGRSQSTSPVPTHTSSASEES